MADSWEVFAIIPDGIGFTIAAVGDVSMRLDDDEELEDALSNAGIDSFTSVEDLPMQMERVRQLNLTGDANAFWNRERT